MKLRKEIINITITILMLVVFCVSITDLLFNGYHDDLLMAFIYTAFYIVAFLGIRQ